ncbi:hypothetical protein D3C87_49560 [compost metagenome]
MILFLQYTLTDSRHFTIHKKTALNRPQWPSPKPYGEFVRSTGAIVERRKQGLESWVGENYVCQIRNGLRVPSLYTLSNGARVRIISKHMYAGDRNVLTKYEFVFNVKLSNSGNKVGHDLMKVIINEVLMLKMEVRMAGIYEAVTLNNLPKYLVDFHYQNSTSNLGKERGEGKNNLIACTPQLYFYLDKEEKVDGLLNNYKKIGNISSIADLYGAWHNYRNSPIRIWIHHRYRRSAKIPENRALRMTIMRLHSEYECLKNLFLAISSELIDVEKNSYLSDELQEYFNTAIRTFLKENNDLNFQSWTANFFDYFAKIYSKASPGEMKRIREKIDSFNFRVNIKNKTINFIEKYQHVENKFENNNSTILAQGSHMTVQNNNVKQVIGAADADIDFDALLLELASVLQGAKLEATTIDQYKSLVALSEVEEAAKKKDFNGVVSALKTGGKWAADVASKFSAGVMVELLKGHTTFLG